MADDRKSPANDAQVQNREQADAPIKDLPPQDVSKDAEDVKGGKAPKNWDIPAGTATPGA